MNRLNHWLFSIILGIFSLKYLRAFNLFNFFLAVVFTILVNEIILKHPSILEAERKGIPWYSRRTWREEPFGFIFIGLPLAFVLSFLDKIFWILILVPYGSHIFLDYLCIFETYSLAPFSKFKKKEGIGIFFPDDLFKKSENSKRWAKRIKEKNIKGISENYFTLINIILLAIALFY